MQFVKLEQYILSCLSPYFSSLDLSRLDDPEALFHFNALGAPYVLEQIGEEYTKLLLRNKIVLDYGCGDGAKSIEYAKQGTKKVIGVDAGQDSSLFSLARKKSKQEKITASFKKIRSNKIPLKDSSVDSIISSSVFEHIDEPNRALQECYRVLKNKGLFALRWNPFYTQLGGHINYITSIPFAHLIFSEQALVQYCYEVLIKYFSKLPWHYRFAQPLKGLKDLNSIVALNKIRVLEFEEMLRKSKFKILSRHYIKSNRKCKRPDFLRKLNLIDYLIDHEVYILEKQVEK